MKNVLKISMIFVFVTTLFSFSNKNYEPDKIKILPKVTNCGANFVVINNTLSGCNVYSLTLLSSDPNCFQTQSEYVINCSSQNTAYTNFLPSPCGGWSSIVGIRAKITGQFYKATLHSPYESTDQVTYYVSGQTNYILDDDFFLGCGAYRLTVE